MQERTSEGQERDKMKHLLTFGSGAVLGVTIVLVSGFGVNAWQWWAIFGAALFVVICTKIVDFME